MVVLRQRDCVTRRRRSNEYHHRQPRRPAPGVRLQSFGDVDSFSGVSIRGSTFVKAGLRGRDSAEPRGWTGGQPLGVATAGILTRRGHRGNTSTLQPRSAGPSTWFVIRARVYSVVRLRIQSWSSQRRHALSVQSQNRVTSTTSRPTQRLGQPRSIRLLHDNGTPYNRIDDQRLERENNRLARSMPCWAGARRSATGRWMWSMPG